MMSAKAPTAASRDLGIKWCACRLPLLTVAFRHLCGLAATISYRSVIPSLSLMSAPEVNSGTTRLIFNLADHHLKNSRDLDLHWDQIELSSATLHVRGHSRFRDQAEVPARIIAPPFALQWRSSPSIADRWQCRQPAFQVLFLPA